MLLAPKGQRVWELPRELTSEEVLEQQVELSVPVSALVPVPVPVMVLVLVLVVQE